MIRRPPRSTRDRSSAASDVYKRQVLNFETGAVFVGRAGPSNPHAVGFEPASAAIEESVAQAMCLAGIDPAQLGAAVLGIASADLQADRAQLLRGTPALQSVPHLSLIHISEPTRPY